MKRYLFVDKLYKAHYTGVQQAQLRKEQETTIKNKQANEVSLHFFRADVCPAYSSQMLREAREPLKGPQQIL